MTRTYAVYLYTTDVPHGWAKKMVTLQSTSPLQAQIDVTSTEEYKTLSLTNNIIDVKAVLTHNEKSPNRTPEEDIAWHEAWDKERKLRTDSTSLYRLGIQTL